MRYEVFTVGEGVGGELLTVAIPMVLGRARHSV